MTILILNYWSLHDGLTQGATLTHLNRIIAFNHFHKVLLVTLEREVNPLSIPVSSLQLPEKVKHCPIYLRPHRINLLSKITDFLILPKQLIKLIQDEHVQQLVAIGTLSGSLAYLVSLKINIPFFVAFCEPHAAYMLDNKVWNMYDPRYVYQKKWEKEQVRRAQGVLVVSEAYKKKLMHQKLIAASKIFVNRNTVDFKLFAFAGIDRISLRHQLSIPEEATIGIYVGKYGGLYYQQEAFRIYGRCFETIPNFRLIILSPQPEHEIRQYLGQSNIDPAKVYIASVPHAEVPAYLSAADFAFATIKSYPSARYCSPVKVGEYWASGLPVLLTEGVGDDSDIIKREGGGAVFCLEEEGSLERALQQVQQIINDPNHRREIPKLARKYRSPERIREAYEYFFGQSGEQQR
ncbi:hypothetical protein GCM10023188_41230 [Pontibacter saemangeumensis]|uniref:Uncharacterized protein n=1 Tax=Pontibacter saemangeumensis TaxID=1084525 RepID=A0ABP8M1E0_9BACT